MAAVQPMPKPADDVSDAPAVKPIGLTVQKVLTTLRSAEEEARKADTSRRNSLLDAQRLRLKSLQERLLASAPKLLTGWARPDHFRGEPTGPKKDFAQLLADAQKMLTQLNGNQVVKVVAPPNRGFTVEQRLSAAITQMRRVQPMAPHGDPMRGSSVNQARVAEFWNTYWTPLYQAAEHFSQVKLAMPGEDRPAAMSGLGSLVQSAEREIRATVNSLAAKMLPHPRHPTVINAFDGKVIPLGGQFKVPRRGGFDLYRLYSTCQVGSSFMATFTKPGETTGTCVRLPLRIIPGHVDPVALIPT